MQLTTCVSCLLLIFILFAPLTSSSPDEFCNKTPFPTFCKSILSNVGSATTIHDYGRISVQLSLWSAEVVRSLINVYLKIMAPSSNKITIQALEDCQLLFDLNVDFLSNTLQTINSTNTLPSMQAYDLHTLLGATLTNQDTCLDGLKTAILSSTIRKILFPKLSNGSMLNSVSLALFKHGWVNGNGIKQRWFRPKEFALSDVIVDQSVTVNPNGSGNFTTINAALATVPNNTNTTVGKGYFVIHVAAGIYPEYVNVTKKQIQVMMIGDGINKTIITGNRSVGGGTTTTFRTATFAVLGQGFIAVNMTFRNTAGPINHQAVAVRNGADESVFYMCSFEGYQDTLYTHSLRQFYKNCDIYGTVDIIFGAATALFQNCNIFVRLPMENQFNAITAQGRSDANQASGIVIHFCTIRATPELALALAGNGTTQTFLGRPWREFSRTVYTQNFIDGLIDPKGWKEWDGDFALNTLYYAEHNNTGAGAGIAQRVGWPGYHVITDREAVNFTVDNFLKGTGWLPATQIPFISGLK